jgi:excisionase family DNA binding protein
MDDQLLTPREVAEILGVRAATVGLWARIGVLKPALLTPGGHRRYRRADVEAFLEAGQGAKITPERQQWEEGVVRLYRQGWSIRQVAARFATGYGATRRILIRHGALRIDGKGRS